MAAALRTPLLLLLVAALARAAPRFKACKRSLPAAKLNECVRDSLQKAVPELVKGIPQFGLNSIDPLRVDSLEVPKGSNTAVSVEISFKNLDILGLKNAKIKSVDMDVEGYKMKSKIEIDGPIMLQGDYTINGKVLVLPIQGTGRCNITLAPEEHINPSGTIRTVAAPACKDLSCIGHSWTPKDHVVSKSPSLSKACGREVKSKVADYTLGSHTPTTLNIALQSERNLIRTKFRCFRPLVTLSQGLPDNTTCSRHWQRSSVVNHRVSANKLVVAGCNDSHLRRGEMVNPKGEITELIAKPLTKDGKDFAQVTSLKFVVNEADRVYYDLQNLFNGNKELGENMNLVLNDNWKQILDDMRGPVQTALGAAFRQIADNVVHKVPYTTIFP
ncbi:hypothetical protein J6590_068341 [Homalodisca vitripennis]|nr:hypothetical protein J6590_068341 [Homalodisca vitripennis]